jgi:short subunit dehydrogenase-like uncharacterized protein
MSNEAWVLGATGRTGSAVAARLHAQGTPLVLVGRNRERLETVAAGLDGTPQIMAGPLAAALAGLRRAAPAVVVSTVGPFTTTAAEVAGACPPGTHYVDVANELPAVEHLLGLDRRAAAKGQTLVTGAGFGVLATESVLLRLCQDRPPAAEVRVDAVASVATEPGVLGAALAATIVQSLSYGGRQVRRGRPGPHRARRRPGPAHYPRRRCGHHWQRPQRRAAGRVAGQPRPDRRCRLQ